MYILAEKRELKTLGSTQHLIHLFPYALLLQLTEAIKDKAVFELVHQDLERWCMINR